MREGRPSSRSSRGSWTRSSRDFFEKIDDGLSRLFATLGPFVIHLFEQAPDGGAVALVDLEQRLQQSTTFLVAGRMGVETANEVEGCAETFAPGGILFGWDLALRIEQGQSRLAGPAQDLHFRDEGIAQGIRGIDDVEHSRAVQDRFEQADLIGKAFAAFGHEASDLIRAGRFASGE